MILHNYMSALPSLEFHFVKACEGMGIIFSPVTALAKKIAGCVSAIFSSKNNQGTTQTKSPSQLNSTVFISAASTLPTSTSPSRSSPSTSYNSATQSPRRATAQEVMDGLLPAPDHREANINVRLFGDQRTFGDETLCDTEEQFAAKVETANAKLASTPKAAESPKRVDPPLTSEQLFENMKTTPKAPAIADDFKPKNAALQTLKGRVQVIQNLLHKFLTTGIDKSEELGDIRSELKVLRATISADQLEELQLLDVQVKNLLDAFKLSLH